MADLRSGRFSVIFEGSRLNVNTAVATFIVTTPCQAITTCYLSLIIYYLATTMQYPTLALTAAINVPVLVGRFSVIFEGSRLNVNTAFATFIVTTLCQAIATCYLRLTIFYLATTMQYPTLALAAATNVPVLVVVTIVAHYLTATAKPMYCRI